MTDGPPGKEAPQKRRKKTTTRLILLLSFVLQRRVARGLSLRSMVSMVDAVCRDKNLATVESLGEPRAMWSAFAELSAVPRPSGKEMAIRAHVKSVAEKKGLAYSEDTVGNILIKVPGVKSTSLPVLIQGHLDMVTEKNSDVDHNFETQGIELFVDASGFLRSAKATTLGADNGIGVATALAVLENSEKPRPPLELLFTIDEERGLVGARELEPEKLGITARTLLNLDTEEWESIYCGCAGGGDSVFTFPASRAAEKSGELMTITIKGLTGGHSGVDIDKNRCNAIEALANVLKEFESTFELVDIKGGDKRNAIPREATATLFKLDNFDVETMKTFFTSTEVSKYENTDPHMTMEITSSRTTAAPFMSSSELLSLLSKNGLTRGVVKFSEAIPGLVETSSNLASVNLVDANFEIVCSTRSSVTSELERIRDGLVSSVTKAGGSLKTRPAAYSGWNPNVDSKILQLTKNKYNALTGKDPDVKAIHAGLECGLLISKISPHLDCVSFGPTIFDAHTPTERLQINTVKPFFQLLENLLEELA